MTNARPHNKAGTSAREQRQYNPTCTTSEAQRQRILSALRLGPKTSHDLRCIGVYWPPARILELRRQGHNIKTELVDLYDRDGYRHTRAARYSLIDDSSASTLSLTGRKA